jgi:hypothetical protein
MIKQKNSAWETLTEEFNSQAGVYIKSNYLLVIAFLNFIK